MARPAMHPNRPPTVVWSSSMQRRRVPSPQVGADVGGVARIAGERGAVVVCAWGWGDGMSKEKQNHTSDVTD